MSDGAKSNCWVLVCRCWELVSILTFRKGVIPDREQRILKIALACPYEAGSFVVILLECLTEGSRESISLSWSEACASPGEQWTEFPRVAGTFGYLPCQANVKEAWSLLGNCSALNESLDS